MNRGLTKQWASASAALLMLAFGACGTEEGPTDMDTVGAPTTGGAAGSAPSTPAAMPGKTPVGMGGGSAGSGVSSKPTTPTMAMTTPTNPSSPAGANTPYCKVRKVLDSACTACHNQDKVGGAPMSLKTYADLHVPAVSDKSKKVFQVVGVRVHDTVKPMPPQVKLTSEQLGSIDTWVAAGGPEGSDPTCGGTITAGGEPTVDPNAGGGATGEWPEKCDAVYSIRSHGTGGATAPYMVPAGQEIHPKISIPAPWGNEAVQMVAMKAVSDNKKVLHHWILYGPNREFLVGWAPGKDASAPLPPDVGMNLPGGNLTLDMHYFNLMGTQAEPDNSGVDLCVLKKPNFRANTATVNQTFSQFLINIPARAQNFEVKGSCTFTGSNPVTLITASPHAHTLARHMKFTVTKKSGEVITMHDQPFDFNEQQSYALTPTVKLESGDVVTTICTFDNPTDRAVTFGENTGNEMCFNFAVYYPMGAMACGGGTFAGGLGGR